MKCKNCGDKFISKYFNQKYCMVKDECLTEFYTNFKKVTQKRQRKETKVAKEKMLTHSDWIQILQKVFNTFIRLRDKHLPCISCGTTKDVEYAAGHFYPTTYSYLRFNEDNVHKQCNKHCNMMLRGNLHEYHTNLIKKIGYERLGILSDSRHAPLKISIEEIKEKIKYYKLKIKELK